jgi:hypothetical protein
MRCAKKFRRLEVAVSFDQPQHVREADLTPDQRRKIWERSKRLKRDSLVCILDGQGLLLFFLVVEASTDDEDANHDDDTRDMWSHPTRAFVSLTPASQKGRGHSTWLNSS